MFPVTVILDPRARERPETARDLLTATGRRIVVRLGDVAGVTGGTGRYTVLHGGLRRYQEVSGNVEGRDLPSFLREAKRRIASDVEFPPRVTVASSEPGEEQAIATREVLLRSAFAGAAVLLVLLLAFRSWRNPALGLVNFPFAPVGGVVAALLAERQPAVGIAPRPRTASLAHAVVDR